MLLCLQEGVLAAIAVCAADAEELEGFGAADLMKAAGDSDLSVRLGSETSMTKGGRLRRFALYQCTLQHGYLQTQHTAGCKSASIFMDSFYLLAQGCKGAAGMSQRKKLRSCGGCSSVSRQMCWRQGTS